MWRRPAPRLAVCLREGRHRAAVREADMSEVPGDATAASVAYEAPGDDWARVRRFCGWALKTWEELTPLGKWLVFACAWRGITLDQLANELGRGRGTFSVWCHRDRYPRPDLRRQVAAYFGVKEEQIIQVCGGSWEDRFQESYSRSISEAPVTDYVSLTDALCRYFKIGRPELARRLGWKDRRVHSHHRGDTPYDAALAPVCIFVVREAPELIPAEIEDPQLWVASLIPEETRRRRQQVTTSASKRQRRKLRDKVSRWSRQRFIREIWKLLGDTLPDDLRKKIVRLPYDKGVGKAGFLAYMNALSIKGNRAAASLDPGWDRLRQARNRPRNDRARARMGLGVTLRWLKAGAAQLFQCQVCGDIVHRNGASRSHLGNGQMCRGCWLDYFRRSGYMQWMKAGGHGTPPKLPRRAGRRIEPEEIRDRIIFLLEFRLGKLGNDTVLEAEYDAIYDMERRLQESSDTWCQRIANRLHILAGASR